MSCTGAEAKRRRPAKEARRVRSTDREFRSSATPGVLPARAAPAPGRLLEPAAADCFARSLPVPHASLLLAPLAAEAEARVRPRRAAEAVPAGALRPLPRWSSALKRSAAGVSDSGTPRRRYRPDRTTRPWPA